MPGNSENDLNSSSLPQVTPLKMDLLRLLKDQPQGVKIYDLLSGVDQEFMNALVATDDYQLSTYRKNFLLMHTLYLLQEQLIQDNMYLDIGQVEISLRPLHQNNAQKMASHSESKVRDYYYDWNNYFGTDRAQVDELLQMFWQRYHKLDSFNVNNLYDALRCLGLDDSDSLTWRDIKKRYRELAHKMHPDRGGSSEKFIELREAYEVLTLKYKPENNE